jgi:hypothetical protein
MSTDIERKAYRAHGAPLIRREGLLEPESLKRQQPGSDDRVCSKLEAFAGCDVVGQGWELGIGTVLGSSITMEAIWVSLIV